jgi:beta-lactamase superfamily II metal-dependent hydrolase
MAWSLDIRTFDVGQGESSAIIASNGIDKPRVMLIDGGLAGEGLRVNRYLDEAIGVGVAVDHIVVTHYDVDHSGGIMTLLAADNLFAVCDTIAVITAAQAANGTRIQQIAACAAAAGAAVRGAYDLPQLPNKNYAAQASTIAEKARNTVAANATDEEAADFGKKLADKEIPYILLLNPSIAPNKGKVPPTLQAAAIKAVDTAQLHGDVRTAVRDFIFAELSTIAGNGASFLTMGRFANTHIIDTGNGNGLPPSYTKLVTGNVKIGDAWCPAPGVKRLRSTPGLGDEVLWNAGPNRIDVDDSAPMVFVMARNREVWNGASAPSEVPMIGEENNFDSYGLLLRFNRFFFYTGGDLIAEGEDLIVKAVMAKKLTHPNPEKAAFDLPHRIAAFKCGHHGAKTCTSQYLLDTALPKTAIISCGIKYGHPDQPLVDRLQAAASLNRFYLTNCKYERTHIPASKNPPEKQAVPGNKSRVAGSVTGNPPGNIRLTISQAMSQSSSTQTPLNEGDTALRQYVITSYNYGLVSSLVISTHIF